MTLTALSEFARDAQGHIYNDDCGPCAEAVALANGHGQVPTADLMHAIRQRDIARGWFTPGGGNTIRNICDDLTELAGVSIVHFDGYQEPFDMAYAQRILDQYFGIYAFIIEVGLAGNLPYSEAGIHYHFVCLLGKTGPGSYVMANGDDVAALQGSDHPPLRNVSIGQLSAAHLCAILVPDLKVGAGMSGVPAGWHDNGSVLTAPNGVPVIGAMRKLVMGVSWDANNVPQAPEHPQHPMELGDASIPDGVQQEFVFNVTEWSGSHNNSNAWILPAGRELHLTRLAYNDTKAAADSAEQRLAIANQTIIQQQHQIEDLTAQNAALQNQLKNIGLDTTAILALRNALALHA